MRSLFDRVEKKWRPDSGILFIALWTPVGMALQEYFFLPWRTLTAARWHELIPPGSARELQFHVWWVLGALLTGVVVPALGLWWVARIPPAQFGVNRRGDASDRRTYLLLYLLLLPVIWVASQRTDFHTAYPLFRAAGGPYSREALIFEAFYCLQFFAVEFFFRGVLVLGLKPKVGPYAILIALTPYCLLHFHKPFPEAIGALVAGTVLGVLAYRSETILYGWALHYAVALTMDCLAWR